MTPVEDQSWRHLRVTRAGAVAQVRLAREAERNALDTELMEELTEAARGLRLRHDVQAVILTGADRFFSAGADLGGVRERASKPTLLEARRAASLGPDLCRAWEEIEAVTIAAVEGYCIGGGCALVLACDFRIMGEGAYMRLPEVPLGMNMSWRTLPRLVSLAGPSRAKQFTMFGEAWDARRCLEAGMADEIAAPGAALASAEAWAAKVAALPPLPVRMTKEAVNAIAGANAHASIHMDRDQFLLATRTQDHREGVQAFFEKRPGAFKGD